MIALANYPTFSTRQPEFGEVADLSNPCMRILDKAVQGLHGLLVMDRIPFRFRRAFASQQPDDALPFDLLQIVQRAWPLMWEASSASTGILLGEESFRAYRAQYPKSTPLRLYDKAFYKGHVHALVEWEPKFTGQKVRRVVFVIYHMESWLRRIWPQTILGIKESLASALVFAFPSWPIGEAWNLPMQPIPSSSRLLSIAAMLSDVPKALTKQRATPVSKTRSNGAQNLKDSPNLPLRSTGSPHENATVSKSAVAQRVNEKQSQSIEVAFDKAVRLLVAEHIAGAQLVISDLPDDLLEYAIPVEMEFQLNSYQAAVALLTRAFHGLVGHQNAFCDVIPFLSVDEKKALGHRHLHIFTSVLWPAVVRLEDTYGAMYGRESAKNFISWRIYAALGRLPTTELIDLRLANHVGEVLQTFQWKVVHSMLERKYDTTDLAQFIAVLSQISSEDKLKEVLRERTYRFNNWKIQNPIKGFRPIESSDQAVRLLARYVKVGTWTGKNGMSDEYQKRTTTSYTGEGAQLTKCILQADLAVGRRSVNDWENKVLGRVFACHKDKLPPRYAKRWSEASDRAYAVAFGRVVR